MLNNVFDNYNPDVLSCLANLSNDEVFTPPNVVNDMLDLLPKEIWMDKNIKFLDPCCKSGVFLREVAKRLINGLEKEIPELEERIDHIFQNQLFGIAITELTSLLSRRSVYCSKYPNSIYSISHFDDPEGNIRYKKISHIWKENKCIYCGASKSEYNRSSDLESHAYEFIHINDLQEIAKMKFDVIIGNPPYHLNDGGHGMSAKPIYHHFIEQAKKLNPKYISMIIPSRWYAGGKGLDTFRLEMLNDNKIKYLYDFENSSELFDGVDIAGGICYFLWDREYSGECNVVNNGILNSAKRKLNEFDIFIRHNSSISILRKILGKYDLFLNSRVSSRKPFGIPTNYEPRENGIPCWFIQKIGLKFADKNDVNDKKGYLDKWKLLIPKAPIAGQTDFSKPVRFYYNGNIRIAKPGECCTESWIIAGAFDSEEELLYYKSYIFTKTVRFLLLQTVVSQDVTKKNYRFVPDLETYNVKYTDEKLCKIWGITDEEFAFIDSKIVDIEEQ